MLDTAWYILSWYIRASRFPHSGRCCSRHSTCPPPSFACPACPCHTGWPVYQHYQNVFYLTNISFSSKLTKFWRGHQKEFWNNNYMSQKVHYEETLVTHTNLNHCALSARLTLGKKSNWNFLPRCSLPFYPYTHICTSCKPRRGNNKPHRFLCCCLPGKWI